MPRWCCKRLLAKQRCGWGGQEGDWCGPQYENHNLRLGSEALRKHAVSIPPKGITRLLFQAPRWACARWAGAGSNELETANAGRQGVWNGTVWEEEVSCVV